MFKIRLLSAVVALCSVLLAVVVVILARGYVSPSDRASIQREHDKQVKTLEYQVHELEKQVRSLGGKPVNEGQVFTPSPYAVPSPYGTPSAYPSAAPGPTHTVVRTMMPSPSCTVRLSSGECVVR